MIRIFVSDYYRDIWVYPSVRIILEEYKEFEEILFSVHNNKVTLRWVDDVHINNILH